MAVRRIVVVGCGSIGQRHARLLAQRPDLQVELCEPNPDCLAEAVTATGASESKSHRDFDEMLRTQPDMAVIATPHSLHAEQAIASLQAGVHVLCEKPMSDNLADADRMAEAAACGRRVLDFGFTLHFHPGLHRLKELITAGELGAVLHVHCRIGTYITLVCSRSRHQADLEGALLFDYVHQPDVFYWLLGVEPAGVYMSALYGGELPLRSNPNVVDLALDYDVPLRGSIHFNYIQMPQRHQYEVVGDQAWAILDMETNCLRIGRRGENAETSERIEVERDRLFEAEHQAFLDAVDGKRQPESPAASAIVSMRVVDAALRSWKQSKRVRIPSAEPGGQ
ncbi:MAG: Gfo/Idh/MocA family oxidoreductase [Sedimentisphaerales bacterium]|nr:Gfo/Idh/MocA family oxidoreductase [Sedimentisphaerales bacterium]